MRTVLLLIAGCMAASLANAAPATALTGARAPLASFQAFLDGLGRRDAAAMRGHVLAEGHATLMRNGKPLQITLEDLIQRVSAPGDDGHEERLSAPVVHVDHDIAIVWARFVFLINGKPDHCGRDVATLVRINNEWLIASIEDTAQSGCLSAR